MEAMSQGTPKRPGEDLDQQLNESRTLYGAKLGMLWMTMVVLALAPGVRGTSSYTMIPRWGHAATFIADPPSILIQGGKTDPTSAYTYTSAPNTGDTIVLPLSASFDSSTPPYSLLSTIDPPTEAWHTISPLASSSSGWSVLSFGGDGGTSEAVQTLADSAWILDLGSSGTSVNFTHQATAWGSQPMRRIHHSATTATSGGKTYITGGLKDDGSGQVLADAYEYDPATSTFSPLPSLPHGVYHHISVVLPNSTLLVIGGAMTSPTTGMSALAPLSFAYILNTASTTPSWTMQTLGGSTPTGRRGATIVLSEDGSTAFMYGGADSDLSTVLGDGWKLDLGEASWAQVVTSSSGAGQRYDHSAVGVGGDQVIVFGGYGNGAPADPGTWIYNTETSTWTDSFAPPLSSTASASGGSSMPGDSTEDSAASSATATASGKSQSETKSTSNQSGQTTGQPSQSGVNKGSSSAGSSTQGAPSRSASVGDAGADSHALATPVRIALVFGLVTIAGLIATGLFYRYRRRRRRQALLGGAAWGSGRSAPARPYGGREKGGHALMEDTRDEKGLPSQAMANAGAQATIGLGMGAIGASLASISSKLGHRREPSESYAVLHDEAADTGGPLRKSTRRLGNGIRLVGPRSPRTSTQRYGPVRFSTAGQRHPIPISRVDMLSDEDSRNFHSRGETDWCLPSDESERQWKSAHSLLGGHDTIDEDSDEDSLRPPPMRGGPVPTPRASNAQLDLNPFDDSDIPPAFVTEANPRRPKRSEPTGSSLSNPFGTSSLHPPSSSRDEYSESSLPRSDRSGASSLSDAEEGHVHHARLISQGYAELIEHDSYGTLSRAATAVSQTASIVLPPEEVYVPVKRSESFFKRMTAGGITGLISRQQSNPRNDPRRSMSIRDPAPVPSLWPVISHDEVAPPATVHPPSSWKTDNITFIDERHGKGLSVASLESARSMKTGMVITQRQTTDSSIDSRAMVAATPEADLGDDPFGNSGVASARQAGCLGPKVNDHTVSESETPGSVIFNGADFASPDHSMLAGPSPLDPIASSSPLRTILPITSVSPGSAPDSTSDLIHPSPPSTPAPSTPKGKLSTVPSGSPVPSPLVSHRRPVREVVNSINRRGGSTPLAMNFMSPASQYSPGPGFSTPRRQDSTRERTNTIYEAMRRSPLVLANPDARQSGFAGGSAGSE